MPTVVVATCAILPAEAGAQTSTPPPANLTRGVTHETQTADVPGLTVSASACPIADDPTYGVTPANPVKVGGGALYVKARSLRFLGALRGPTGEGLHFKRLGSFDGPDDTILDVYQVDHNGQSDYLYVDAYRFSEPKAPRGFICAANIPADPPGPDPFETRRQLITLAATLGESRAAGISLDADGSAAHGVVFDHARLVARTFAAAAAAGRPLDTANVPAEVSRPRFVVIAYPVTCDGQSIPPEGVTVSDSRGGSPAVIKEARGKDISIAVPGLTAPDQALAIVYGADLAIPGQVEIRYARPCGSAPATMTLPFKAASGRITRRVTGHLPPGVTVPSGSAQVRVQVCFDFDGLPHFAAYAGGPASLANAAIAAVADFRADPPRVNGAAILQPSMIAVGFQP